MSQLNIALLLSALAALLGCDPPPGSDYASGAESDTGGGAGPGDSSEDSERGTGETDDSADDSSGTSCIESVFCMIQDPASSVGCMEGMSEADEEAAGAVALCAILNCSDSMESESELAACLLSSCTEEAMACLAGGIGDFSP